MGDRTTRGYWPGMGYFLILPIEMVHSGVLFIPIYVEGIHIEMGLRKG